MMAQMESLLEVANVDQFFRTGFWMKRVQILHGISLGVRRGSICGFLGANGAGKTTLIHLIVGLRKPTAGNVRVCGFDAASPEARSRIGYLPERPYFHEHLSGEDFLTYFGQLSGMTRNDIRKRIPEVLAAVGLSHARELELRRYSKGMLQRVGIAQAILHEPEFLVLDEPMSGLDPVGRKEMRELIATLAAKGHTVFFSSHVIPDVEAVCDDVVIIQKGRVLGNGPIGRFLAQGPVQTEIAFAGLGAETAARIPELAPAQPIRDGMRMVLSGQDEVTTAVRKLIEAGGKILWVTPIRPTLESMFGAKEERSAP